MEWNRYKKRNKCETIHRFYLMNKEEKQKMMIVRIKTIDEERRVALGLL